MQLQYQYQGTNCVCEGAPHDHVSTYDTMVETLLRQYGQGEERGGKLRRTKRKPFEKRRRNFMILGAIVYCVL